MTPAPHDVTFVLFTFNEEKRIERAIKNFFPFGRVLVVDNESIDQTREIALGSGCNVLVHKNPGWVEDEITAACVKDAVTTPWIYWGFADEMVAVETLNAILKAVRSGACDIVSVARKNYFYGMPCQNMFADRTNRVFKKDAIDFVGNKIHCFGRPEPKARIYGLPSTYFVHHFISNTAKSYLQSMDRYTDTESLEDRPLPSVLRLILYTAKIVIDNAVLRRGYRAGTPAAYLIVFMVFYRWLSAMKLYEKAKSLDRESIELKNDAFRNQILASFR